jgi:predicted RNase H-like nuclease (RuvC/YqgF family)
MLPPETQKRIFLLERENEKLRAEVKGLKDRINNQMNPKYKNLFREYEKLKALTQPKATNIPMGEDAVERLKDMFRMKG